jgi:hypothetical protein
MKKNLVVFCALLLSCQPPPTPTEASHSSVGTVEINSDLVWGIYNADGHYLDLRKSLTPGFADLRVDVPNAKKIQPVFGDWGAGHALVIFNEINCEFVFYKGLSVEVVDHSLVLDCLGQRRQAISGDWNGDGRTEVGVYFSDLGVAVLNQDNVTKDNVVKFEYGAPNSDLVAITGDWNNDGLVTLGLWNHKAHRFDLTNSNKSGVADVSFEVDKSLVNVAPFSILRKNDKSSVGLYSSGTGLFRIFSLDTYAEIDVIEFGVKNSVSSPVFWK